MSQTKYLGLDLSTQSLTALVVDLTHGVEVRRSINFDDALPRYGTTGGVPLSDDPKVAQVDPLMWVEALELMLQELADTAGLENVAAVSVSAQQHGTVYLNHGFTKALGSLDTSLPLAEQLRGSFSRPGAPIWMDSSTSRQCGEITGALGGEMRLVSLTGSVATERFAGPQIRKFQQEDPAAYQNTAHIALISSFVTSLLCGAIAPVDSGDGLGANLADLNTMQWSAEALRATAPDLAAKLPPLVSGDREVGTVAPCLCRRFGFSPACRVIVGTGDNPASLAGLGLVGVDDSAAVSLGTSDTYFGYTKNPLERRSNEGHLFGAADGGYMYLICFKNGSLARQAVKDFHKLDWEDFSGILLETAPGNQGRVMLPYVWPEITPKVLEPGICRYGGLDEHDAPGNVRAVAEAQVMSMYLHSGWVGKRPGEILVTAGGSGNKGLLKTIAAVFGAGVKAFELRDSAALGAALRAARVHRQSMGRRHTILELSRGINDTNSAETVTADRKSTEIYQGAHGLLEVYAACERHLVNKGPDPRPAIERFKSKYN